MKERYPLILFKKALWLAAFLGLIYICINYLVIGEFDFSILLHSLILMLIAYVVGTLAEKKELVAGELGRSQRESALVLENLTEVVVCLDREQNILNANPAASRNFGLEPEELIGRKCYDVWHQRQNPCDDCPVTQALKGGQACRAEVYFPDGRCWNITASPMHNERGEIVGAVKTAMEITEQKKAKQAIEKLNNQLEERVRSRTAELEALNEELDAFNYSVSHDLRAPLRSIEGFSQALLEDYADDLDDQGRDYLLRVINSSKRMNKLIDDLLKLSRVTLLEMCRERVNLSDLAASCLAMLQEQEPQRQVEVFITPGIYATGDASLLHIALENLFSNAWKFTAKVEHARIEFGTIEEAGRAVCYMRDNGAGFNMAYADKLFKAFQRLHDSREYTGTGIGLSIVSRIIQRHGGNVWAQGEVGKGSVFYFTLPKLKHE